MGATKKLSKRELEVLKKIRDYLAHNGGVPSYRQLGKELGYASSPQRAAYFITRLVKKGFIKVGEKGLTLNTAVAIPYLKNEENIETIEVPILGAIPCGSTVYAEECVESKVKVSTQIAKKGFNYFMLRTTGISMDRAGIEDGDVVLVRQDPCPKNGDIVAALIDGESTLKEYRNIDGLNMLIPRSTSPDYQPIVLSENCSVQGVVVKIFPGEIFPK